MSTVSAYAATSPTAPLTKTTIERRDPGPHDVAIDIKFAGICHSDIHTAKGEWGTPHYPLVPGHEIAGVVTAVGSEVTKHKVGDHVGVGCMVNSCGQCSSCKAGLEQYCKHGRDLHLQLHRQRRHRRRRAATARRSSSTRTSSCASPTRCRWTPRRRCCARASRCSRRCGTGRPATTRGLAIIGLGGLGHMGVKLGAAMGAEVTVLSQSLKKMEDGLRLGAKHYYATAERDTFKKLRGSFDLILNTVSANLNLGDYLSLLDVDGTLVELGIPEHPMEVPALLAGAGAPQPVRVQHRRHRRDPGDAGLLRRAQRDCPKSRSSTPDYINEAYERVLASDVRYRFVIDVSTL